ncbi:hypothetical protein RND71_027033 [Anisodus tanguticus]|uniref:6,7-dimethyl-8-ribityllumazine synthase n=1 Tax=Anisodus tanguticus TaxID=243964 RepID=A0AAE1RLY6_9SOLA|nr:hypothetical protein RND71_027033 [Anisodus tanguticus]
MAASALGQCNVVPRTTTLNPQQSQRQLYSLSFNRQTVTSSLALSFTQSPGFGSSMERHGQDQNGSGLFRTDAVRQLTGSVISAKGHRFAVVVARFSDLITKKLLEGALDTFKNYSVREEDIDIRGDTSHYDAVVNAATSGVNSAGLNSVTKANQTVSTVQVPPKNMASDYSVLAAFNRTGGKSGNKGAETALAAVSCL